jgi:hypothetical protein
MLQPTAYLMHFLTLLTLYKGHAIVQAVSCRLGRAIAQAVSRRLPTAAARVQTQVWSCGIL